MSTNSYAKKDWSELKIRDNQPATEIPKHIAALADPNNERWDAVEYLWNLYDAGKIYSAAAKAIPEIIKILHGDNTKHKDIILVLLAATLCGKTHTRMVWGLNLNHPEIKQFYARGVAKEVWKEVWAYRDLYLSLLNHEDAMVRSAAAFLLAFDFESAGNHLPIIESRISKENVIKTKASFLLSAGMLCGYIGSTKGSPDFKTIAADNSQDILVRGAAVIGFLYSNNDLVSLTEAQKDVLIKWCLLGEVDVDGYAWNNGITDMHTCRVVEGRCVDGGIVAAEILAECIRRSGPIGRSHKWADGILELAFPQADNLRTAGPFFISADYVDFSSISDRQRALLEVLSSYSFTAAFQSYGIPSQVCDRRRWLGLEEPGPMERVVDVEVLGKLRKWPVWKCILEQYASRPYKSVDVEALLGKVLTPTQLLEVRLEYSVMAYGLTWGGGQLGDEVFKMVMERSKEMLPYAREHLRYMSRMFNEFGSVHVNCGAKAAITAMHILIKEGFVNEILPEDDILLLPGTSVIYKHFDLKRREKFILACLEKCFLTDDSAFWYEKSTVFSVVENLNFFPTESIVNMLFDLRDHIVLNFNDFSDVCDAIETGCQKISKAHKELHKVVKRRLKPV